MNSNDTADQPRVKQENYNCLQCEYTGFSAFDLKSHVTKRHTAKTSRPFECSFSGCGYCSTSKNYLKGHIRNCHEEKRERTKVHAFDQCDFKAYTKSRLLLHAAGHSDERPFVCGFPSCSYRSKRRATLVKHKKCHDPHLDKLKIFSCKFCGHRTRFRKDLTIHLRTHSGEKPYSCDFPGCNHRASQSGNLQAHRRRHDPDLMFKCNFPGCGYKTAYKYSLDKHQRAHNPERRRDFECSLCPKAYAVKGILLDHIKRVHTKELIVTCKICNATFNSKTELRLHTAKAHAAQTTGMNKISKKYQCTACGFQGMGRKAVIVHQQGFHSSSRDFQCNNCEFRTKYRSCLRQHRERCPGMPRVRSFKCHLCKKGFFTRVDLAGHLKTVHRPDKLHKCQKCDYATNYTSHFRVHLKKQHPEKEGDRQAPSQQIRVPGRVVKPRNTGTKKLLLKADRIFTCDFPGCSFITTADYRYHLTRHQVLHRPEMQNIQCPMCPRKFFSQDALNVHISRFHAKEKPFKCDMCDYSAVTATVIRMHKQRIHSSSGAHKTRIWRKETDPEKNVRRKELGISESYACPFCEWTHTEYTAVVRHTVAHRLAVISLKRTNLVFY